MRENTHSKKQGFSCPVSLYVPWYWGLIYQDCPVVPHERDSDECRNCPLRGITEHRRNKDRPKREDHDRDRDKKPHGLRKQGTHGGEKKVFAG